MTCLWNNKICLSSFFYLWSAMRPRRGVQETSKNRSAQFILLHLLPIFQEHFLSFFDLNSSLFTYIMPLVVLRVFRFGPRALGAFHSELEVYGKGYSFMGGGEGVYETNPQMRSQEPCKAVLHLGYTKLTPREVDNVVKYMQDTHWGPTHYHPLSHNCNCFCKQLAKFLGVSVPPYWVNRAGRWAAPLAPKCVVACGVATWDNGGSSLRSVL